MKSSGVWNYAEPSKKRTCSLCGHGEEEIGKIIDSGTLNALFVLGRSIGFIGHIIKKNNSRLYRHPWDDILFPGPDDGRYEEKTLFYFLFLGADWFLSPY